MIGFVHLSGVCPVKNSRGINSNNHTRNAEIGELHTEEFFHVATFMGEIGESLSCVDTE